MLRTTSPWHPARVRSPPSTHGLPAEFLALYQPIQLLGKGVSAQVFLARQRKLDRMVVVKVLSGREDRFPTMRARFLQEARLLQRLSHPNVVELLDHGDAGGILYMTFPDLAGASMDKVVWQQGAAPVPRVTHLLRDTLAGLDHLHQAGLVHRDLKPANLLVTIDGSVRVLDLGLARELAEDRGLTETGAFVGTALYAAPDQVLGRAPDPRDDVYSAGVVAYEALARKNPFGARTLMEALEKQLHHRPPLLDASRSEVPRRLALLLDRMLAKTRDERPTAAEALAELDELALPEERQSLEGLPEESLTGTRVLGTLVDQGPGPLAPEVGGARPGDDAVAPADEAPASRRPVMPVLAAVGLLVLVTMAGLWTPSLAPGPVPPSTTRDPAPPRPPFPEDAPERALAALQEALAWRVDGAGTVFRTPGAAPEGAFAFPEVSPALSAPHLAALDGVADVVAWLARGGRPQDLSATMRFALVGIDSHFRDRGLPEPFFPALHLTPQGRGKPASSLSQTLDSLGARFEPPAEVGPWFRAATEAGDRLRAQERDLLRAMEEGDIPRVEIGSVAVSLHQLASPGQRPARFLRAAMSGEASRVALMRWLDPARRAFEEMLYAGARSIREEPKTSDLAALYLWTMAGSLRDLFLGPGAFRPAELLLAGPPAGFALQAASARVEDLQERVHHWVHATRGSHPERRIASLRAALQAPAERPTQAGARLEAQLLQELLEQVRESSDPKAAYLQALVRVRAREALLDPYARFLVSLRAYEVAERIGAAGQDHLPEAAARLREEWPALKEEERARLRREERNLVKRVALPQG